MKDEQFHHGSEAWFRMLGTLLCEAAANADLPEDLSASLLERYTDGTPLADGLVQGIRFDIIAGRPSFRIGVRPDERADVVIEITAAAARTLNKLRAADPDYRSALDRFAGTGEMRVEGNPSILGSWLPAVHDRVVERTA